jgi:hypothetical protein
MLKNEDHPSEEDSAGGPNAFLQFLLSEVNFSHEKIVVPLSCRNASKMFFAVVWSCYAVIFALSFVVTLFLLNSVQAISSVLGCETCQ